MDKILYRNFPDIISDNEQNYYIHLYGIIESVDAHPSVLVTKRISGVTIRITPSSSAHLNAIIKQVNILNNTLGLRVEYAKSMKSSVSINFNIDF